MAIFIFKNYHIEITCFILHDYLYELSLCVFHVQAESLIGIIYSFSDNFSKEHINHLETGGFLTIAIQSFIHDPLVDINKNKAQFFLKFVSDSEV